MFGRKKLPVDAPEAQAVVLKTKWISENTQKGQYLLNVHLRVHFDDGSTTEFSSHYHHIATEGDVVKVRFDPNDHSKVELVDETWKEQRAARDKHKEDKVARAEQQLSPGAGPPDMHPPPPPEAPQPPSF